MYVVFLFLSRLRASSWSCSASSISLFSNLRLGPSWLIIELYRVKSWGSGTVYFSEEGLAPNAGYVWTVILNGVTEQSGTTSPLGTPRHAMGPKTDSHLKITPKPENKNYAILHQFRDKAAR